MVTALNHGSLRAGTIYQIIGIDYSTATDEKILDQDIDVELLSIESRYGRFYKDKDGNILYVLTTNEISNPENKMHTMSYSSTNKTLEAGAEYSTGGEFKILDKDISNVTWVDSDDKYDAYVLSDGSWIFTRERTIY